MGSSPGLHTPGAVDKCPKDSSNCPLTSLPLLRPILILTTSNTTPGMLPMKNGPFTQTIIEEGGRRLLPPSDLSGNQDWDKYNLPPFILYSQ